MTNGQFEQLLRHALEQTAESEQLACPVRIDDHLPSPRYDEDGTVAISRADYADYCQRLERRLAVPA